MTIEKRIGKKFSREQKKRAHSHEPLSSYAFLGPAAIEAAFTALAPALLPPLPL
jgi:hypothetical protein